MANFDQWDRETLNEFAREATRKLLENEAEIERLRDAVLALKDTEIADLACIGSHAPVEDALGKLFALVPNDQHNWPQKAAHGD